MNEQPNIPDYRGQLQSYGTSRKVITPLNPNITPEPAITVPPASEQIVSTEFQSVPLPSSALSPIAAPQSFNAPQINTTGIYNSYQPPVTSPVLSQVAVDNVQTTEKDKSKLWKIVRLIAAAILGGIIGFGSYAYWAFDLLNYAYLLFKSFGPIALLNNWLGILVAIGVSALLLRFVIRTSRASGQAVFVVIAVSLISIILAGIFQRPSVLLTPTDAIIVLILGAIVGGLTLYLAERVWTWRLGRSACGVIAIVILALSAQLNSVLVVEDQKTTKAESTEKSADALSLKKSGDYKFSPSFDQLFPSEAIQKRFEIIAIGKGTNYAITANDSDQPTTFINVVDTNKNRTAFSLSIFKRDQYFKPPNDCGHPDYRSDYVSGEESCGVLKQINDSRIIYGQRNLKPQSANEPYDGYFLSYDNTVIAIDNQSNSIAPADAIIILESMDKISISDLTAKSKALATKNAALLSNPAGLIVYPVFSVGYIPGGYTLTGNYLKNAEDPANTYLFSKYESASPSNFGSSIRINQFKRPADFAPPNCGKSAPGVGIASTTCQPTKNKTVSGKKIYYGGSEYYGDYGDSVITISGSISGNPLSETEVLRMFDSLSVTDTKALDVKIN